MANITICTTASTSSDSWKPHIFWGLPSWYLIYVLQQSFEVYTIIQTTKLTEIL